MEQETAKKWDALFAFEQSAIDEELARVGSSLEEFQRHHANRPGPRKTLEEQALDAHGFLIMASVLSRRERILPEFRVHLACFAVMRVTDIAQRLANSKGRLKELAEAMEAIRRREGLGELDFWTVGEGPADYWALSDESERECAKIADTVTPAILRRYRMDDLADLFEHERRSFDMQSEIGRRITFPADADRDGASRHDELVCQQFGVEGLRQIKERVREIRRLEGTAR